MLLTGFAFENLLKGILFGRDASRINRKPRDGHNIVKMAEEIISLTPNETNFLERLEQYLVWAGRYQLPLTAQQFINQQDKISVRSDDLALIDQLFEKLAQILSSEWQARKN